MLVLQGALALGRQRCSRFLRATEPRSLPAASSPPDPAPAVSPHPAPAGLPTRRSLLPSGGSTGTYLSQEPTATSRAWPSPRGGAEGHPGGGQPRSTTTETSPAPHVLAVLAVAAGGRRGDEV